MKQTMRSDITVRQARLALLIIFIIGLGLRITVTTHETMGINLFSDDNAYLNSAVTFVKTGFVTYARIDEPSSVLGPGMPILLGLLFSIFGYQATGLMITHILFSCIGLLTAFGVYQLGALLHSRKAGVLAAAFLSFDIGLISTNSAFYTETPYMCMLVYILYFLIYCTIQWKLSYYLAGLACLCGAIAFKGLALLAPISVLPLIWKSRVRFSRWAPKALLGIVICMLVFLPWCMRNKLVSGTFSPFPISQGDQKLLGTFVGIGYPDGTYNQAIEVLDSEAWNQNYQDNKIMRLERRGEYAQQRLLQWFTQNPFGFLFTHMIYKPVDLIIQPFYPAKILGIPERVVNVVWWSYLGLAFIGLLSMKRSKSSPRKGFYTPLIFLVLAVPLTAVMVPLARYNAPHAPFVMLYASVGVVNVFSWVLNRRRTQKQTMEPLLEDDAVLKCLN